MDAFEIAKICLRRFYVFVPIVLLAVAAGVQLSKDRPSSYTGVAAFTVTYPVAPAPSSPTSPEADLRRLNPLFQNGPGPILASVAFSFNSVELKQAIVGLNSGVEIGATGPDIASIVSITAVGPDSGRVITALQRALSRAKDAVVRIQSNAGAKPGSLFTPLTVIQPQITVIRPPSRLKLEIAALMAGVLGGGACSIAVDAIVRRRQRRRRPGTGLHSRTSFWDAPEPQREMARRNMAHLEREIAEPDSVPAVP